MHTSAQLTSPYDALALFECAPPRISKDWLLTLPKNTYAHEYYVAYANYDGTRLYTNLRSGWNCNVNGLPSKQALKAWITKHNAHLADLGHDVRTLAAVLLRVSDGKAVAKVGC